MSIGEALLIPPAFVHESRAVFSGSCESAKVAT